MVAVIFPDIETEICGWLGQQLRDRGDTARVVTKVPTTRPARFVRLVRAGGTQRDLITDRPRIVFECWDSAGDIAASDLARLVRALVTGAAPGWIGTAWCDKAVDAGMAFLPDLASGTPRYLVTIELHITGSEL
ncbi:MULTISPECIES: hypothetical protein [Actinomycetes]|uniref:hypothetical protein n=1 Tax=Micromonospora sp. NPDC005367 TaxID=3155590 RepID=UPI0033ACE8E4